MEAILHLHKQQAKWIQKTFHMFYLKEASGTKRGLLKVENSAYCFCILMVRKEKKQTLERQPLNSIHQH